MPTYECLFSTTADAMCEIDRAGRLCRRNPPCDLLLGRTDELASLIDCFAPEVRLGIVDCIKRLSSETPTVQFEGYLPTQDRWTSWQLTWLAEDQIVAVGRDVTEQHSVAQSLAEKRAFLHSIIEAEPECVKLVAADGTLLEMNRAGLRMISADSREQVIDQCVFDLIAEEDRSRFIEFHEAVCAGESGELSFDIIAFDGCRRSMETIAVPLPRPTEVESEGELIQLSITRDVTQRLALEDQLRQSQRIEAVGQLAGGVAHDFNNLLAAMIGPAELALLKVGEDHQVANELIQIRKTGESAARLTQKLLTFSRQHVPKIEVLSPAKLVHGLRDMLQRLLNETIQLDVDVPATVWPIRGDRCHIEQVVMNLVLNARDALNKNGRIQIRVDNASLDAKTHRKGRLDDADNFDAAVRLQIEDDGCGIPEQTRPQIFDPFFTTKSAGHGTGLGLSICYGIVKELGGSIDVESVENSGTTVTVLLPAAPEALVSAELPSAEEVRSSAATIMVVEDEPVVRGTIVRLLEASGHEVYQAGNGEEALQMSRRLNNLDLIISDMTMPVMGGRELAERLKAENSSIKVLLMTGYLTPNQADRDGNPETGILLKPFRAEELSIAVNEALSGSAAAPQCA